MSRELVAIMKTCEATLVQIRISVSQRSSEKLCLVESAEIEQMLVLAAD